MSYRAHTVNQTIHGGVGGPGGGGGLQGGDGGPGEAPRLSYNVETEQFTVNNYATAQMDSGSKILANLKRVAAHYNAVNTPEKCMDGTRVDIIKDLVAQLTSAPDSIRLVMLSGVAGSGKSTIAKTVATILDEEKNTLAASFFFSRDYTDRKGIDHIATTLAIQLANHSPAFQAHLIDFLENDRTGICEAGPQLQFQKLVVEILGKLPPFSKPWVICLDALDECGEDRGQTVLRWLSDSIALIPAHIRFFLTGRPDVPSYLKFDTLRSLMYSVVLDELEPSIVQHDIRLYVEQSLNGANWTTRDPWKIQSRDAEEITTRANGLFVFAATAVRYVLAGLSHVTPQDSINHLLNGEALTDLYNLYLRIMDYAIPKAAPGAQRAQSYHNRAMKILSTILNLLEPLDYQSLADLLELEKTVLLKTLLPLSSVIHVSDTPGKAIRIIHLSFREFMMSYVQVARPEILCGTDNQQRDLVFALMKVLDRQLKFNICDLPTSYLRNIDMPEFQWRLDNYIPLHLQYAAKFWVDHVVEIAYDSWRGLRVQNLLFKKFLFWLEVLSLLGIVSYGQEALSKLMDWAKKSTSLIEFGTDAKRFISFFGEAINQSAPHIYLSALALAPEESKITEKFSHEFPRLITITKGRMKQWPNTIAIMESHTNVVTSVAFSPDGKKIISASTDRTVRIWDAETGAALKEPLEGHTLRVTSVAFSPDSKRIVSGSNDRTVRIWDAETGAALKEPLKGHTKAVTSVAFSPDGKRIVSGSEDWTVCMWDAETGAVLMKPLEGHNNVVTSVAFSPDSNRIVSASTDRTVCIWDAETGAARRKPLNGHTDSVTSVTFSPDGKIIVSGSEDWTVCMWDAETGAVLRKPLEGHTDVVNSVAFSPDGKKIVSASTDRTVRIWDAGTGAALGKPLERHTTLVTSLLFSSDGKRIASASTDRTVHIWDAETGAHRRPMGGYTYWINSVAFSPDGKRIVSGSEDWTVRIWDTETGAALKESLNGHTGWVTSAAFSPDGKKIVSGSHDDTVRIWDTETGAVLRKPLEGHTHWITSVAFSPDGKRIVSSSRDNTVRIWDAETGALRKPLEGHNYVTSVAFSPDGKKIVSSSNDRTVRIWDAKTGAALKESLKGHTGWVTSVAFSSDGKKIVSGSNDRTVRIWDAETGATLKEPLKGHTREVTSVAFSLDGKRIVSGSEDWTVCIWDAETGAVLRKPLEGHTDVVNSVAFSPDGKIVVSSSNDRTVRIWDAETGAALRKPLEGHNDVVNSVAFSPDGKRIVSSSDDRTLRIWDTETVVANGPLQCSHSASGWHLLNSLHLQSPSAPLHWQIHNGWVSCLPSELLFWLPKDSRVGLWSPHNTLVIGQEQTALLYDKFVCGTDWAKCYAPEKPQ